MGPTLSQVLAEGAKASSFNPLYLLTGVTAIFFAALSVFYHRGRLFTSVMDEKPEVEKLEKLSFMIDELKIEKQKLSAQNFELQNQLLTAGGSLGEMSQARGILEKSNLALQRECEKLKAQKEQLVLQASPPLVRIVSKKKKEAARRPKRVSGKAK